MLNVTKRFGRSETRIGEFAKEPDAVKFIMEKLREDIQFKISAVYCLYEGVDLLREYTQSDVDVSSQSDSESGSQTGQGKSSGKSFAPTPFSTTPRMGPQSWIKDDNKNEDEKEGK